MTRYLETRQACGHTRLWPTGIAPQLGDNIYCHDCQDMRRVVSAPGTWRAWCLMCDNWRISRVKIDNIHAHIHKHILRNPLHHVVLVNYDESEKYIVKAPQPPNPMIQKTNELSLFEIGEQNG
jgi:hypothetical protein